MLKLWVSKDSESCAWMPMLTKEIECCGGFGERVVVSVCRAACKAPKLLTGSKWIQGRKRLPSPSCQFWFCRDEEGLKTAVTLLVMDEKLIREFSPFSCRCVTLSVPWLLPWRKLTGSLTKNCQPRGTRGMDCECWGTLSVPGFPWGCSSSCVKCCYSPRCAWLWPVDKSSDSKAAQRAPFISTAVCLVFWTEGELNCRCL